MKVNSSAISEIDYNAENKMLSVLFVSGRKYNYENVEQECFDKFCAAESNGKFFNAFIKNCYYEV